MSKSTVWLPIVSLTLLLAVAAIPLQALAPDFLLDWGGSGAGPGQFDTPQGVATDSAGNVWVVDSGNHRVQKFDANGTHLLTFGSLGTNPGELATPRGIAVAPNGEVLVSDGAHRVQKFSAAGSYLATIGSLGTGDGQLLSPDGIAFDGAGNFYVASSAAHQIQKFDSNGNFLLRFGSGGTGNGELDYPLDVALSGAGEVFVADSGNSRVQVFDDSGAYLRQWGGAGSGAGQFGNPIAIDIDSAGSIYVTDQGNDRVQQFNLAGNFLASWGTVGSGPSQFNVPRGLAVGPGDEIYVADRNNNRIEKFGVAGPVEVSVHTGAYLGTWDITNQTGLLTGDHTVTLDPGTYLVRVAALASGAFTIDVESSGLVTVQNGVSATGGFNVLDFRTEPVAVDAGAYPGQWGFLRVNFGASGDQTVDLVPALRYLIHVGGLSTAFGGGFEVHLAADGNVTSFAPQAAIGGLNSLLFLTTPVTIDASTYPGQWGILRVNLFTTGDDVVDLLPSLRYRIQVGDAGANPGNFFDFDLSGGGQVQPIATDAAIGGDGLLAFQTRDVAVDVGDYSGGWGFARVNYATNGSQTVSLVRDLTYSVRIANLSFVLGGAFVIDLGADGTISVANGVSAIGSVDALDFRTFTVGVDPGSFANTWSLVYIVQQSGIGYQDLVPGVSYQLKVGSDLSSFALGDPCQVNPSIHQLGGASLEVFCGPPDSDQDGVPDDIDNCPLVPNGDQVDQDVDGLGNVCDDDLDGDAVDNQVDNCPSLANADQLDLDGDGIGDDCDLDTDGDAVPDDDDNCPLIANTDQSNSDGDLLGDACDPDDDQDQVDDEFDNCPFHANPDQLDFDGDGAGDVCDGDSDGDGVPDEADLCPATPLDRVVGADGCSGPQRVGRACVRSNFAVKGHYVSCVSHESKDAERDGLLTAKERARLVKEAAQSD